LEYVTEIEQKEQVTLVLGRLLIVSLLKKSNVNKHEMPSCLSGVTFVAFLKMRISQENIFNSSSR